MARNYINIDEVSAWVERTDSPFWVIKQSGAAGSRLLYKSRFDELQQSLVDLEDCLAKLQGDKAFIMVGKNAECRGNIVAQTDFAINRKNNNNQQVAINGFTPEIKNLQDRNTQLQLENQMLKQQAILEAKIGAVVSKYEQQLEDMQGNQFVKYFERFTPILETIAGLYMKKHFGGAAIAGQQPEFEEEEPTTNDEAAFLKLQAFASANGLDINQLVNKLETVAQQNPAVVAAMFQSQ